MRIVMFTRYSAMGASSRYRLLQYVPLLEDLGHQVEVHSMLDDKYLEEYFSTGRRSVLHVGSRYLRRGRDLGGLDDCELVICEQEFFPYLPPFLETWQARRCRRLVVDYDDAAYIKYRSFPGLRNRIPKLMAAAEAVVVGNRYLEDFAARYNRNVRLIPTVVDTSLYKPKQHYTAPQGVRLVWIGTPNTAVLMKPLVPLIVALRCKYPDLKLRLIGAGSVLRDPLPFAEVVEWSDTTEAQLLAECDVGLMPLPDNDFTRGKCGLKLIQYMAAGLPVVASPVGANCDVVSEGRDGYLASDLQQWFAALERLIEREDLRCDLGRSGLAKARQHYSLAAGFEKWISIIQIGNRCEMNDATSAVVPAGS